MSNRIDRSKMEPLSTRAVLDIALRAQDADDAVPVAAGYDALEWCDGCRKYRPEVIGYEGGGRWYCFCGACAENIENIVPLSDLDTADLREAALQTASALPGFDYALFLAVLVRVHEITDPFKFEETMLDFDLGRVVNALNAARGEWVLVREATA